MEKTIGTLDREGKIELTKEAQKTLDRAGIIKEYMHELAMKSVKAQKGNKKKFSDMGKLSAIVRRANSENRKRQKLDKAGEAVDFSLK